MKIIRKDPNPSGAYPPIQEVSFSKVPEGCALIPAELDTKVYYDYSGYVELTIVNGIVTSITGKDEEYNAWKASLPEPQPEPDPEPDQTTLLTSQVEALSERQDFLEDCIAEMAAYVY